MGVVAEGAAVLAADAVVTAAVTRIIAVAVPIILVLTTTITIANAMIPNKLTSAHARQTLLRVWRR